MGTVAQLKLKMSVMSVALIGSTDVTGFRSQTWSVLVSMGRMLPEEIPTTLPISCFAHQIPAPGKKCLLGHPKTHNMTSSHAAHFLTAIPTEKHNLYGTLLQTPVSWACVFREAKDTGNFCLTCLPLSSYNRHPSNSEEQKDTQSERFLRLIKNPHSNFFPSQIPMQI